ncbi:NAD(P)/FAD-dependent oxidoreductase [Ruegeria arenilitoris]|uniref:NAD(P)/FAD-dependent oxidoreductase n=1 Tax=Ruegeria arenilitoris TaxID=1173585 RepID=UPI00147A3E12|nr:FAD-binding oxidoreductase [Ruegeria arenilitoris]
MKRIFPNYSYGPGPRQNCWWDETTQAPDWPIQSGESDAEVAVIGGGFTGLSAALHLAEEGRSVVVLEAEKPGWGASGRNGGFCCLGGSKLKPETLVKRYGEVAAQAYEQAEVDAVDLVAELLARYRIEADTHSKGETVLAHSAKAMKKLRQKGEAGGVLHEADDLPALGLGGTFFGGYTTPVGFGLNPRKYLFGLAAAARDQGAELFQRSAALDVRKTAVGYQLSTPLGSVRAEKVLFCTNGYSSEDFPLWMAGRYMPAQSTVLVTRPLTDVELQAQGWSSNQICYDTRHLLHYFRLMPDKRFLFGMRGGLISSPKAEAKIRKKVLRDFHVMFPAWSQVEVTNIWSGFVCLARDLLPFVGAVPDQPGCFAGFAYHGNGVAMGSYCGQALARLAMQQPAEIPLPISTPPRRFPLGRWRRALMPPAYALMALADL